MEKSTRAELIAALVTDKHSGFRDGDEPILEAASDARLEEFRAASDAARSGLTAYARLEAEHRNVAARLKVAEEKIRAGEQPLSEDEFVQKAPASIRALLEAKKAEEDAERAALVSVLKDCGAHTEDELKKKTIPELQTLAKYARLEVPNFSGRGVPQQRNASDHVSYAPPDPYAAGLKTLQNTLKAVN